MMRKRRKQLLCASVILGLTISFAGCGSEKAGEETAVSESSVSTSSVITESGEETVSAFTEKVNAMTEEERAELVKYFTDHVEPMEAGKDISAALKLVNEEAMGKEMLIYSFTVEETAVYDLTISGIDQVGETKVYVDVLDDFSNVQLELTNVDADKKALKEDIRELSESMEILAGVDYYISVYAETLEGTDPQDCQLTLRLENTGREIQVEEQKEAEATYSVKPESYLTTLKVPEESDYYYIEANILNEDQGHASIYYVLEDGKTDVYYGHGLCWMEKGHKYYIVYGIEDLFDEKVDLSLYCDPVYIMEAEGIQTLTVEGEQLISYTADRDGDILVYSISETDPTLKVYNTDYQIVAESIAADGLFSDNKQDFAALMHVKTGEVYYLYVSDPENKACELHFEEYTEE